MDARSKYVWTETRFQNEIMVRALELENNGNGILNRPVYNELIVDLTPLYLPYN